MGRAYAFGILTNTDDFNGKGDSVEPARTKIINYDFTKEPFFTALEYIEKKHRLGPIPSMFYPEQKDLKLVALERLDDFIVMTFAYMQRYENKIAEIPGKGKMVFSIVVGYDRHIEKKTLLRNTEKLIRKIANLPLIRSFSGYAKAEGRWLVIDFQYTYNQNDYYKWFVREEENYQLSLIKRVEQDRKVFEEWAKKPQLIKEESENYGKIVDSFLFDWVNLTMESQFKNIQKYVKELDEVREEAFKTRKK